MSNPSQKKRNKAGQSLHPVPYVPRVRATFVPDTAILVPTEQFWCPTKKLYNNRVQFYNISMQLHNSVVQLYCISRQFHNIDTDTMWA
jgi:hypothetical protein